MIKIIWFKNAHEQRLNWLKFGLMQMHFNKKLSFCEKDNVEINKEKVTDVIKTHVHRHTVIIKVIKDNSAKFILVNAEDSFFHLRPLVKDVDLYFCSSYNSDFFIHKKAEFILSWQNESDVEEYKKIATELIQNFGNNFYKVKKLCPIGPSLDFAPTFEAPFKGKLNNLKYKLHRLFLGTNDWSESFSLFEKRYQVLLGYRNEKLNYDVVLNDSLWGWPEHRIDLHKQLQQLSTQFNILSELRFNENKHTSHIDPKNFPMVSNPINGDYEQKLASSRLGVFATGFHFGWRNIVMLALMAGIPVYSDEIILEPYFDLNLFKIFYNKGNFEDLSNLLNSITEEEWLKIKKHNQAVFDEYMHPLKVAEYFMKTISESI